MWKGTLYLTVFVLCFWVGGNVPAITVTLNGEVYPDPAVKSKSFYPRLSKLLDVGKAPPANLEIPQLAGGKKPVLAPFELGDEERLLILAFKYDGDPQPTILHFDRDGDGKYTRKDPPVEGQLISSRYSTVVKFPAITAKIKVSKKTALYSFRVEVTYYEKQYYPDQAGKPYVRVFTNCCFAGNLRMGGRRFRVLLADGNVNGRFNDMPRLPTGESSGPSSEQDVGDRIYLAPAGMKMDDRHGSMFGDVMVLGNKTYSARIGVSSTSRKLSLTPISEAMGTVKMPMQVTFMNLYGIKNKKSVVVVAPSKTVKIPQDTYKILEYRVICNDQQGDLWCLAARGTKETPSFEVGKEDTTPQFGQPFYPQADIAKTSSGVRLSFKVVGSAEELVTEVTHLEGNRTRIPLTSGNRPKEASYKIVTGESELVGQGTFRYG